MGFVPIAARPCKGARVPLFLPAEDNEYLQGVTCDKTRIAGTESHQWNEESKASISDRPTLTTTAGNPIADNQNALTAGMGGPELQEDDQLNNSHNERSRYDE